jgi:hypothetical protein
MARYLDSLSVEICINAGIYSAKLEFCLKQVLTVAFLTHYNHKLGGNLFYLSHGYIYSDVLMIS